MIEVREETDGAGIRYRVEIDRRTGRFTKTRLTPPPGPPNPQHRGYAPVHGRDHSLITVVPEDQDPVWFIAHRLRDHRPASLGDARQIAKSRFVGQPAAVIEDAVILWRGDHLRQHGR